MIVSADTVTALADGLVVSFPVIAVAYFAAAGDSTDPADVPTARDVEVPPKWQDGWRWAVVRRLHHHWKGKVLQIDERVVVGFDRGMILGLGIGVPCSLAARVFADHSRVARILVAVTILVLVLTLNAMLIRAVQKAAVRQNVYASPRGADDPLGPFQTLRRMSVTLFLATAATAVVAVLLATST